MRDATMAWMSLTTLSIRKDAVVIRVTREIWVIAAEFAYEMTPIPIASMVIATMTSSRVKPRTPVARPRRVEIITSMACRNPVTAPPLIPS